MKEPVLLSHNRFNLFIKGKYGSDCVLFYVFFVDSSVILLQRKAFRYLWRKYREVLFIIDCFDFKSWEILTCYTTAYAFLFSKLTCIANNFPLFVKRLKIDWSVLSFGTNSISLRNAVFPNCVHTYQARKFSSPVHQIGFAFILKYGYIVNPVNTSRRTKPLC